jgi:hypothetical protein
MERFQRYSDLQMYLRSLAYTKKLNNLNLIYFLFTKYNKCKRCHCCKNWPCPKKNICVAYGAQTVFSLYLKSEFYLT